MRQSCWQSPARLAAHKRPLVSVFRFNRMPARGWLPIASRGRCARFSELVTIAPLLLRAIPV